jgi:hypothetical protein
MRDDECVTFLRWSLPRLELRWNGYRKVRILLPVLRGLEGSGRGVAV